MYSELRSLHRLTMPILLHFGKMIKECFITHMNSVWSHYYTITTKNAFHWCRTQVAGTECTFIESLNTLGSFLRHLNQNSRQSSGLSSSHGGALSKNYWVCQTSSSPLSSVQRGVRGYYPREKFEILLCRKWVLTYFMEKEMRCPIKAFVVINY